MARGHDRNTRGGHAVDAGEDSGNRYCRHPVCCLPDAGRAQSHRLYAAAPWSQPRWSQGLVPTVRRCPQIAGQGGYRSDRRQQVLVHHCAYVVIDAGACCMGGDSVYRWRGGVQHRCRTALRPGDYFDGRIWRDRRRLGVKLEVCVSRRDAFSGADRGLRNCHGVCAGLCSDDVRQS